MRSCQRNVERLAIELVNYRPALLMMPGISTLAVLSQVRVEIYRQEQCLANSEHVDAKRE